MPRSIKVQTNYVDTIRVAVRRNGFQTQRALAERAGYSLATVKKFLGGKPVDFATFTELCETLNVDWEAIADLGDRTPLEGLPTKDSANQAPSIAPPFADPDAPSAQSSPPQDSQQLASQPQTSQPQNSQAISATTPSSPPQKRKAQDWGAAVDVSVFYGREQTLATLEDWIVRDRTRLVALGGIGGIGKTTLTAKLAHSIAEHFDYLIWRSLKNAPPVQEILKNLFNFFLEQPGISLSSNEAADTLDAQLRQVLNCARDHRCLIVFDNVEPLFEEGDRAGTYRAGYEGYGDLFKTVGEADHNSCFIITSRELPKEITLQAGDALPTRCLHLSGLTEADGEQLVKATGELTGTAPEWQQLIQAYSGNPLALKMIAAAVRDYFDGDIASFLALSEEDSLIFGDIRQLLVRQISRLTPLEKDIMYWLAINREPVAWQTLKADLLETVPLNKVLQAIDSLERRSLIEKDGSRITQQAVIMDYFTGELIQQICDEISEHTSSGKASDLFNRYALVKANARDYIRQAQTRFILTPVAKQLQDAYASVADITTALTQRLEAARQQPKKCGYVGGNVLTLLRHLNVDLTGYDFSNLAIWQAYLQGINLYDVDFSGSALSRSVFNQPFGSIRTMSFSPVPFSPVAFSPDGPNSPNSSKGSRLLATGDTNSEIWLWQTAFSPTAGDIKSHISTLQGHQNWVCSVVFSPDGTQLVSGSADRTVKVWDVQTGACLQTLEGHQNWVMSVAFSPDGTQLVSGSADRTVKVWDVQTGECLQTLEGHGHGIWSVAFSPDGTRIVSGSADLTIRLWDAPTKNRAGKPLKALKGHEHGVWTVAFSPDGKTLASGSADQTVRIWDAATGKCKQTLTGHNNWVWMVAFSPDGRSLASGSADRTVRVWDLKAKQCLRVLSGHNNWVWSVAFSPDGNYLTSGSEDRTMRLWNTRSGRCLKTLQGSSNWVWAVAFSPDGETLASGQGDRLVHLWDMTSGDKTSGDKTSGNETSEDKTDIPSGLPLETLTGAQNAIWSVAFSPDGKLLVSGNEDGNVHLWQLPAARPAQKSCCSFSGHAKAIWSVAFDGKGKTIASASADQSIKLWEVDTGKCQRTLTGHKHWVCAVAFHPTKNLLASGSYDRTIKLWDLETGACTETWKGHTSGLWHIAFSPEGDFLVSSSIDQTVRIWAVSTGKCLQVLKGHENWVMAVAISPDGEWIASGSADRTVKVWKASSGELVHTLSGHSNSVWSVAFSPDGNLLASGSDDKTIRLWDVKAGKSVKTLKNKEPYEGMRITDVVGLTDSEISTLKQLGARA
ncbi:MAG: NB-ARC domain-containing protein [Phormidesmis sp.]